MQAKIPKKCVLCDKDYQAKTKRSEYCSLVCSAKGSRKRRVVKGKQESKDYYYSHKRYMIEKTLKWIKNNPEKARENNLQATQRYKEKTRYGGMRKYLIRLHEGKCPKCGSKKNLQVHHKDRVSFHNSPKPNNSLENLELMCQSCHLKHHALKKELGMKRKSDTLG